VARLRVLGVDPGSVTMGVGVIDFERGAARFVHLESLSLKSAGSFTARLGAIFGLIDDVIALHQPDEFAIEQIFMYRSPESSLKLAQARGARINFRCNIWSSVCCRCRSTPPLTAQMLLPLPCVIAIDARHWPAFCPRRRGRKKRPCSFWRNPVTGGGADDRKTQRNTGQQAAALVAG